MGGLGSTRWAGSERAQLVENCISIQPSMFRWELAQIGNSQRSLALFWVNFGFSETGMLAESVDLAPAGLGIRLTYQRHVLGSLYQDIEQLIPVVSQARHLGGEQHYFLCPECNQRVLKLYLPVKHGTLHLCRACHPLTYRSCQNAHLFDRGYIGGRYPQYATKYRLEKLVKRFETATSKRAVERAEKAYYRLETRGLI